MIESILLTSIVLRRYSQSIMEPCTLSHRLIYANYHQCSVITHRKPHYSRYPTYIRMKRSMKMWYSNMEWSRPKSSKLLIIGITNNMQMSRYSFAWFVHNIVVLFCCFCLKLQKDYSWYNICADSRRFRLRYWRSNKLYALVKSLHTMPNQ